MSVEIRNLTHIYGRATVFEKKALDNVSLTIEKGELFGLIGHTGSGKSTLIQHINGILKPDTGSVLIDGEDVNSDKQKLRAARLRVGLVFQYPEHQLFETTVFKDVSFGPGNLGLSEDEIRRRAENALALTGIPESMFDSSPFDLSGGEKRRVAIAGILAMEPEILIMDEPTAGLDPRGRDEIFAQIKKIRREMNNTIIIVSHSMDDMASLADRIGVLDRGRLKYVGKPADIFPHAEELEKIGLSAPQITSLIKALNNRGFNLPEDTFTVEAAAKAIFRELREGAANEL